MNAPENFDQLPLEIKFQTILAITGGTEDECANLLARAIYNSTKYRFDPVTRTFSMPPKAEQGPRDYYEAEESRPPAALDYVLPMLLKGAKGDALIGDLNELFVRDCKSYGVARARRMYWGRALKSLWPLVRRAAARGIKLGVFVTAWHYLTGH
jgi:hypothetical protein